VRYFARYCTEIVVMCVCYDATVQSRYPLEEGYPCLFNCLKRMDSPWRVQARLREKDVQCLSRLFTVRSVLNSGSFADFNDMPVIFS
jgi:hypothetical protein